LEALLQCCPHLLQLICGQHSLQGSLRAVWLVQQQQQPPDVTHCTVAFEPIWSVAVAVDALLQVLQVVWHPQQQLGNGSTLKVERV
jgi:hypothetical protein